MKIEANQMHLTLEREGSIESTAALFVNGNSRGKQRQTGERDTDLGLGGVWADSQPVST